MKNVSALHPFQWPVIQESKHSGSSSPLPWCSTDLKIYHWGILIKFHFCWRIWLLIFLIKRVITIPMGYIFPFQYGWFMHPPEVTCHLHKRGYGSKTASRSKSINAHPFLSESNIQYANELFSQLIPLITQPVLVLPKFIRTQLIHQATYSSFLEGCFS